MIVLTKLNLKVTYESASADLMVHATLYCDDVIMMQSSTPKDMAFDDIQEKIAQGWKQGA